MSTVPITVLLVEDNPADARLVREFLNESGSRFLLVHERTLADGLARLQQTAAEVLLLDLSLPDAGGLETLIRTLETAPDLPVIVMTGHDDETLIERAMAHGAQDYLVKGTYTPGLLERCIRHAISRTEILRALRESQERYALAVHGANDGIWDWSLETGELYTSPRWKSMLGYAEDELSSDPEEWFRRIHPDEVEQVRSCLDSHLEGRSACFEVECRMRHKDGDYRWVLTRGLAVHNEGQVVRVAGSQSDITARKEAEQRLQHSALHDELTGLANRSLLLDRLTTAILRSRRDHGAGIAVLTIAIDRFDEIEGSFGHTTADQVLLQTGERLHGCLRAEDTLARVSRDRFALLLERIRDPGQVYYVVTRLRLVMEPPLTVVGNDMFVTLSIGITISQEGHHRSAEEYLKTAAIALQRAQVEGGGRYQLYEAEMHQQVLVRFKLENELREGLSANQFCMYYQPIVELASGRIAGFEALLRWQHPDRGMLPPARFIMEAEEIGLLTPISESLLPAILDQLGQWQLQHPRTPPLFINFNVSMAQFSDPSFLQRLQPLLADHRVLPFSFGIELTEGMIMEDPETALEVIQGLQQLHVRMLLDDFGIGYSSLSRLHRLPINALKIDRSFIAGLGTDPESSEISRAIIMLAHALGMTVTAEGIETDEQLRRIRSLRCELGQGYLFSPPVPVEDAGKLLASGTIAGYRKVPRAAVSEQEDAGRVLVVDDDLATRQMIRLQLEEEQFTVECAGSGPEALDKAYEWKPEVILLDIQMPGMDGIETCRHLKQSTDSADIPVLFVTGRRDDDQTAIEALSAGGNDFLSKDSPTPILCSRVRCQVSIYRAQAKLRAMAMTDELTGLYTRRFLFQSLRREVKNSSRRSPPGLACLLADADHFKDVNDSHGHIAGDRVLQQLATTIDRTTRETDIVARFGGEEFVIVVPATDRSGAQLVAEKIRTAVELTCEVTVSIGVALMAEVSTLDLDSAQQTEQIVRSLLHDADTAMYAAKERGRNCVVLFDELEIPGPVPSA